MAENSPKKRKDLELLKRFWIYARPWKTLVILAVISVPLVSLLGLAPPMLIMHGIDVNLMGHAGHPYLTWALRQLGLQTPLQQGLAGLGATALSYGVVLLLEYVVRSFQIYTLQSVGVKAVGQLRQALYQHVSSQSASFFDRNPTGALLTRTTSDVEALTESLSQGLVTLLGDILNIVVITAFMLALSPKLTLVSFAIGPVLVLTVNFFRKKLRVAFVQVRRTLADVNAYLQEQLSGVRIVQLFNQETRIYNEFKKRTYLNLQSNNESNFYDASLYAVMEGMAGLSAAGLLWYGGGQVFEGVVTLGLLVAFNEYIQRIFVPVKELSSKFAVLQQAVAVMERVVELLDNRQCITPGERPLPPFQGAIRLENVSFAYTEKSEDVLKDIQLEVKPQQVVALVGATGSGKTTIGKLLTRMYDGYRGSITLDGLELKTLFPESVRSQVGVVQQDVLLFDGSIAFNISLGNPNISLAQVEAAAKLVQADAFIRDLPGGYDFRVSERGANLSAGQAQLLAFARVMAHDPPVVLLDEATASIDSQTEALIQEAISTIFKKKTVLVIAHRLSTIQAANRILCLKRGEVVEAGTHEELLAMNGYYATLYSQGFVEELATA